MVTIIDRTLTTFNTDGIDSQDLNHFCGLLFTCGVTKIELASELVSQLEPPTLAGDSGKYIDTSTCFLTQELNPDQTISWKLEPNELIELAIPSGQIENICDQKIRLKGLEDLMTQDYNAIFKQLLLNNDANTLDLCPSNQKHCATAIALEWIMAGGQSISCGFANRHDFPPLEEVLMGLKLRDPESFNGDLTVLNELRRLYEKLTAVKLSKMKAIIGEDIFKVESGIHVDGVLKNPHTYEPFNPQIVGNKREIVLGKHSGHQSILYKLKEQNLSDSAASSILKQIKGRCTQLGRNLSDLELRTLASEVQNDYDAKIYC
ncbi:MAG: hypothetical protein L6276_13625 [Acetobacterium sp.]|nr:hypothetical protein [Bacillota bacterium]MCG2731296.1 hypothetical protein [Acetobacterium sp.]